MKPLFLALALTACVPPTSDQRGIGVPASAPCAQLFARVICVWTQSGRIWIEVSE